MKPNIYLRIMLIAISLSGVVSFGFSQELTKDEAKLLEEYTQQISSANPVAAKKFLEERFLIDKIRLANPENAASLIAKAEAITDLEKILDLKWTNTQENELSSALSLRIDFNKPLSTMGIGPEPEKLLPWLDKYTKYGEIKKLLIKKSIRQWEVIFGTNSVAGKPQWDASTIRERNLIIGEKANQMLEKLLNTPINNTNKATQEMIKNADIFKYLDPTGQAKLERFLSQMRVVEQTKLSSKLLPEQINQLNNQPLEYQAYILGGIFDGSKLKISNLEPKIDGLRQSRPNETLSYQNNQLMAGMLQTAITKEVKGSVAGDKVLKFYQSGNKLQVAVESCQNCYAKYDPSTNKIIFDSELVQQYMRVNDWTTEAVLKDKNKINSIAKYLSPMFVHEASHQMQHSWADKAGIYKPYTQEDEIESNSMEGLYTIEKLKKDKKFAGTFNEMKKSSVYAQKRLEVARRFNKEQLEFEDTITRRYYPGLPSFKSASSEILSAISEELQRRKTLGASETGKIETNGFNLAETMKMTSPELVSSVGEIKTSALMKIQDDLLHKSVYTDHYQSSQDWSVDMLKAAKLSNAGNKITVPSL